MIYNILLKSHLAEQFYLKTALNLSKLLSSSVSDTKKWRIVHMSLETGTKKINKIFNS